MLILTRKKGESIKIGDEIEIFITEIKGDKVRIGISAPEHMKITRTELYLTVENNKEAVDKVDLLKVFQLTKNLYASNQEEKEEQDED
ncbi:carbon storage regulator CsrA [Clostridium transplantifaecale]|uniref:carbon storage regulator CsrA n=1 Tax=Clostridium transplantifaecale TaxID=2479838 RepID=UPI000F6357B5|nr:carbon storage regulator CsrA [Clostridium transplantifaecale]